jgi:hypothetical protein
LFELIGTVVTKIVAILVEQVLCRLAEAYFAFVLTS